MTLNDLDLYFRSFLNFENFMKDPSKNGIQVQNTNPESDTITKVAFAVDACFETIEKTISCGAQVLMVHHGIFWGHEQPLIAGHYKRLKALIENNIALYACHIPLDANEAVGNNYGLARKVELNNLEPFGVWNNMTIGVKGSFDSPVTMDVLTKRLLPENQEPLVTFSFGKKEIRKIAIVSGGAEDLLFEAIAEGMDAYITGELSHESYHCAKEACMNVIAGGHYNTETMGVMLLADKLAKEKNLETVFLEVPTGL